MVPLSPITVFICNASWLGRTYAEISTRAAARPAACPKPVTTTLFSALGSRPPYKDQADGSPGTLGDLLYARKATPLVSEEEWVELVESIAGGDQGALNALYERTHRLVFTLTMRITQNRETAEELRQDTDPVWAGETSAGARAWRTSAMTSTTGTSRCSQSDLVLDYALHALAPAETSAVAAHISVCPDCRQELEMLRELSELPTDVLQPSTDLGVRLARRVAEEAGVPPLLPPAPRSSEPEWEEVGPGIFCKLLAMDVDDHRVSMLVRLAPGARGLQPSRTGYGRCPCVQRDGLHVRADHVVRGRTSLMKPRTDYALAILLIEDDDDSRQVMAEVLTSEGYAVFEAADGVEALSMAQTRRFDLVVTDLVMPKKDGFETIRELLRSFPNLKIIAMSGDVQRMEGRNNLATASDLGAHLVIRKPIELADLLRAVSRMAAICATEQFASDAVGT
jgi:CheY-like chemotaxis protein